MYRFPFLSWLLVVALAILCAFGTEADAATPQVSNIARVDWTLGGTAYSLDSNRVDVDIVTSPVALTTYRPNPGSGTTTVIRAPLCQRSDALSAAAFNPNAQGTSSIGLTPTTTVHVGEPLIFKLVAPALNRDPNAIDSLTTVIVTSGGDRETLTVFETGPNTGEFVGTIATRAAPPPRVIGDCVLTLDPNETVLVECTSNGTQTPIATATLDVLIDPYGLIFDSEDGTPVSGASVTLINTDTGAPATVLAPDGVTAWPSTVISGQAVRDAAGASYPMPAGEYHFPFVAAGHYQLKIVPPSPYTAPSVVTPAQLVGLVRPDGGPLAIDPSSYGNIFQLSDPGPVRIDVPVDRPASGVSLTKTASRVTAAPGDLVLYQLVVTNPDAQHGKRDVSLTDTLPPEMRLRPDSVRIDGKAAPSMVTISADGHQVTIALGTMAPSAVHKITYALQVRPDAPDGQAINRARTVDSRGATALASAAVRITHETIADRMTLVGRVVDADCNARPPFAHGVGGVRVLLEDGSYTVTDADGRYHFEGLMPETHVVQLDTGSLPAGAHAADCARSTRSAGSAISRFVEGQGGSLVVADFHVVVPEHAAKADEADPAIPTPPSDREAAGAERDWFAGGGPTIAWLFPDVDANPRAPAVRVAIRHLPDQVVTLFADGKPVDLITFDGHRADASGTFAVSLWRGVPLSGELTHLSAEVRDAKGTLVTKLDRDVHFVATAARAEFLLDKSRLIADGVHRPVLAVRMVDRDGRPVHSGSVGTFQLSQPYQPAVAIDAEQTRVLSGLERAAPTWRVAGDDGIAYIALAPTTTSGAVTMDFSFRDRDQVRRQRVDGWLAPGEQPWTIVGLTEGRAGLGTLGNHLESFDKPTPGINADGRVALYAKGRILGHWLLTLSYDSAKRREDQPLSGAIDPNTYYTVYADQAERRFGAASTHKLYLKLETRQFYALFGDFDTGFTDTDLGRYSRSTTGLKAQYRGKHVDATAFAAKIATNHHRVEIQGNGLTGPYALGAHDVIANSEQVVIEVRDRLRSDKIVDRRTLTRFVDYDIDYVAGTLRFSSPVLSRDSDLNPQFIVVDFEIDSLNGGELNAGARATWRTTDDRVRIGVTGLRDAGDTGRTTIGAADARVRIGKGNEIRAEVAASHVDGTGSVDAAWQVEVEHHDGRFDVLGYARQQAADFGVSEQNLAERGRRKIGVDASARLTKAITASMSAWNDTALDGSATRYAVRGQVEYRTGKTDLRLGMTHAEDQVAGTPDAQSTLIEAGATQRLFDNRLELDASTSFAIGHAESVDFPAQHKIGARFQIDPAVALVGSYEIANGDAVDAHTARIGFDLKPWAGARLTSAVADQATGEYGRRAFAAYGLAQSLQLGKHWSVDVTLDGNHTLSGIDPNTIVNPAQPAASGGFVGSGNTITEDFTAVTLGATYRGKNWSGTARAEYRLGSLGNRQGFTAGLIRRLGDGQAFGALLTWTHATTPTGTATTTLDAAISGASRPTNSRIAILGKLDWLEDVVTGAVAGTAAPVGTALLNVDGNARSRRVVGSVSADWSPYGHDQGGLFQRSEISVFVGGRYVFDRIDNFDLAGLTTLVGLDARLGLGEFFEIGGHATVRGDLGQGNFAYAAGPAIGIHPAHGMLVTAGWNFSGFADRDFAASRDTHNGPYVSVRFKFDQTNFASLGLFGR